MRFLRPLKLRWPSTRGGHGVDPVRRLEGDKHLPGRPLDGIHVGARSKPKWSTAQVFLVTDRCSAMRRELRQQRNLHREGGRGKERLADLLPKYSPTK